MDFDYTGFEWIDFSDSEKSVISFLRRGGERREELIVVCNFTPAPRYGYEIGVPAPGYYKEILNSDSERFGGSNLGNGGGAFAVSNPKHGRPASISIVLPPLGVLVFKRA